MSTDGGDKVLWVAILFAAGFAYGYVPHLLQYVADLAAVNEQAVEKPSNQLKQNAEEAIQLEMLEALVGGPNYNLEASALRMIVAKFMKTSEKARLLEDLSATDWSSRDRAINVLKLLLSHPALAETDIRLYFIDKWTFQAVVRALIRIDDARGNRGNEHGDDDNITEERVGGGNGHVEHNGEVIDGSLPSPVRPLSRHAHEKSLLWVLYNLFNDLERMGLSSYNQTSLRNALEAGLVTEWLTRYPFPIKDPKLASRNYDRWSVVDLLERDMYYDDDPDMARVVNAIKSIPLGARQLRACGLWKRIRWDQEQEVLNLTSKAHGTEDYDTASASSRQVSPARDDDNDVLMIDGEQTAGAGFRGRPGAGARTREEELIRRRNRQAIVVLEAGAPLRPENILQRQPTETDLTSLSPLLNGDPTNEAESHPTDDSTDVVDLSVLLEAIRPTGYLANNGDRNENVRGPLLDRIDNIESSRQDVVVPDPVDIDSILDLDSALNDAAALAISDSRQLLSGGCFVPEGVKQEVYKLQHVINAHLRKDEPPPLNEQPAPDLAQCVIKLNQICTLIVEESKKDE